MSLQRIPSPLHGGNGGNFRNNKGSVVGTIGPDGFLEKRGLSYDRHHLRSFGAWATEARHIDQLAEIGGRGVRIYLIDGRVFESSLVDWQRHAFAPRGLASNQLALPDKYWRLVTTGSQLSLLN